MSPYGGGISNISWTNADNVNGMSFINDGNSLLYVSNASGVSVDVTVTGISAARTFGSQPVKVTTVPAGQRSIAGYFPCNAFNQADSTVQVDFSAGASITVAVIKSGVGR